MCEDCNEDCCGAETFEPVEFEVYNVPTHIRAIEEQVIALLIKLHVVELSIDGSSSREEEEEAPVASSIQELLDRVEDLLVTGNDMAHGIALQLIP